MITPERTCVICRTKKPKNELFRFVVDKGIVKIDKGQKEQSRGFYICSKECWDKSVSKKRKIRIGSDAKRAVSVILPEKTFEEVVEDGIKFSATNF
ncbi:MAG TPA: YlxR family protein [Patescibacteria group bacterium]|nr:YlxR family protein [Patescibacteria group bacterium]